MTPETKISAQGVSKAAASRPESPKVTNGGLSLGNEARLSEVDGVVTPLKYCRAQPAELGKVLGFQTRMATHRLGGRAPLMQRW